MHWTTFANDSQVNDNRNSPLQHYILGAWYKPEEIGRRAAIFSISGQAATLFSGPLQSTFTFLQMLAYTVQSDISARCASRSVSRLERSARPRRLAVAVPRVRIHQYALFLFFPRLAGAVLTGLGTFLQRFRSVLPAFFSFPTLRQRRRLGC